VTGLAKRAVVCTVAERVTSYENCDNTFPRCGHVQLALGVENLADEEDEDAADAAAWLASLIKAS